MTLAITELRKRKGSALESGLEADPFAPAEKQVEEEHKEKLSHIIRRGVRCATEQIAQSKARGRSPLEIVLDASEGFVPLWEKNCTLRWRFKDRTLQQFKDPLAAKAVIEQLLAESILEWRNAAPIKFSQSDTAWDFEIAVEENDDCDPTGCVLASAFFPDAGRHTLKIFPKMLKQKRSEQVETLVHEIGHVFGLRHFFALELETPWPAEIFGEHKPFGIMNYGDASVLTDADRDDLRRVYELAWSGELTNINGTPIRFVRPFHTSGAKAEGKVAVELATHA
jgi:hypothetical protein